VERHERQWGLPVAVAMEGYNGYARPLDERVLMNSHTGLPSKLSRMMEACGSRTQRSEVRLPHAAAAE
jgi:hypothetical protein